MQINNQDICLFTNNVSPGVANLVRILNFTEGSLDVFADSKTRQPLADHDICFPIVQEFKKKNLLPHSTKIDKKWSVLFFTWAHWVPYSNEQISKIKGLIEKSNRVILLYDASFGSSITRLLQQIKDLLHHKQIFKEVNEVCYMTDYPKLDLFSKSKKRFAFLTSAAVNINYSKEFAKDLYMNYDPKAKRPLWAAVSGNLGTNYRQEVLKVIETFIKNTPFCIKIKEDQKIIDNNKIFFWSVGDSMLSLDRYFDLLRNSNFAICLPGTYWTPRPFESITCGAIPILGDDYLHSYDIPFEDNVNCVIIKNSENVRNWFSVLKRIHSFSDEKILSMRENVHKLRKTHLLPEIYVQRQKEKFGIK